MSLYHVTNNGKNYYFKRKSEAFNFRNKSSRKNQMKKISVKKADAVELLIDTYSLILGY